MSIKAGDGYDTTRYCISFRVTYSIREMLLGGDRTFRDCGIELSKAEEMTIEVAILISTLDLPVTERVAVKLRQELWSATSEIN